MAIKMIGVIIRLINADDTAVDDDASPFHVKMPPHIFATLLSAFSAISWPGRFTDARKHTFRGTANSYFKVSEIAAMLGCISDIAC